MSEKKNIDRLFQEQFKDFEVTPDDALWNKIQDRQKKDKKRIIIPFWWKFGGAAASLLLLLGFYSLWNIEDISSKKITTSPIVSLPNEDMVTHTPVEQKPITNTLKQDIPKQQQDTQEFISPKKNEKSSSNRNIKNTTPKENYVLKKPSLIAATDSKKTPLYKDSKDGIDFIKNSDTIIRNTKDTSETFTTNLTKGKGSSNTVASITNTGAWSSTKTEIDSISTQNDKEKKSIFDVIKEKESKEELATLEEKQNKWQVTPNIAPVYYNSAGSGSSISNEFSDNKKDGGVNISYGIQVAYAINKKFSIRSGVRNVNLNYTTQDIGFAPSINAKNITSIDYNANSENIVVSDFNSQTNPKTVNLTAPISDRSLGQENGVLHQEFQYIEVPLETSYKLLDTKLGIDMIGGISTLFLTDNSISIDAGDFTTPIGEANNLNAVSFSGNIGLGVHYNLGTQLQLNLEPILKYQFNALNNNPGDFKPYYFGVYTGINFNF